MSELPATPDFNIWPVNETVQTVSFSEYSMRLTWSDGRISDHHVLLLRENSPDPITTHPKAREMAIAPTDIVDDVTLTAVELLESGVIRVEFSDGLNTAYHPGWLFGTAWFGPDSVEQPILWNAAEQPEPPTFDGPEALKNSDVFLEWLEALRDYGVARLRNLPQQDGLLEQVVTMIGPVRESNFGRQYVLEIKDDPDSQAYTSGSLLQHIDLPTRELPFGLQFLYTRDNTTTGGEGVYVDAYRIAEDMRTNESDHFYSLTTDVWEYNNRAKTSDYRGQGPVVETNAEGAITGVRYNTFLRAPLKAPLDIQARAYKAYRAFCTRAQSPEYQMKFSYQAGDLLAFDNRRALHGRAGYDAKGGARFIEGLYADRDDLYSRIRTIKRQQRAKNAT
ncbi:TauD/TfdA family dioxygenase [Cochlodiniinecator piscidefendens]|uniref:TauD/TfdA family dioxygenase n=1 Tax=Cochlodiniinecator piscidefendens TaxID=2715756 RepID=UPI00140E5588|nr:TauD/TfdA family dioxygenase [Cochlodiniinecator piscidefendens]